MIIVIIINVIIIKTRINKINNNNKLIRKSISYTDYPLPRG